VFCSLSCKGRVREGSVSNSQKEYLPLSTSPLKGESACSLSYKGRAREGLVKIVARETFL